MVFDKIENKQQYLALHPNFYKAFDFLESVELGKMADGTYELDGRALYAMISSNRGKTREEAKLEAHREYIDIQYVIAGDEQIGWRAYKDCVDVLKDYSAEKDIEFFSDEPLSFARLLPGTFAIFFPGDAHAPLIASEEVRKVVVKVEVKQK